MSIKVYEGELVVKKAKFGIVAGRFNEFITNKLIGGAIDALKRHFQSLWKSTKMVEL